MSGDWTGLRREDVAKIFGGAAGGGKTEAGPFGVSGHELAVARDVLFPKQQGPLTPFQLARMKRHAMAARPMQMRYVWLLQRGEHKITAAARAAGEEVGKVAAVIRRKARNKLKAARRAAR